MYPSTDHRGSAILISLFILIVLTLMTTVFMEKLLSFAKSSEGIEGSNKAYYHAIGIIEESLYTGGVNKYTPWNIKNTSYGNYTSTGKSISTITGGTRIPIAGYGNSQYDKDWNTISLGDPVQIVIPEGITWGTVGFRFRIPQIEPGSATGVHVSMSASGIILWTLSSTGGSLFASGETNIFIGSDIDGNPKYISAKYGTTSTGLISQFDSFYLNGLGTNGSQCTGYRCTLKLSMVRDISTSDGANKKISFLEYQITGFNKDIPQEYMRIESRGYAQGFSRSRVLELPQITTNNALDFAVLQ